MIEIIPHPLSVNVLFNGTLEERTLIEDEWEIHKHPFVIEVAIDQTTDPGFSMFVHWSKTEPEQTAAWERQIFHQVADEIIYMNSPQKDVHVLYQ